MTEETQLEIDFVKWLAELSADVPIRYGRWFETEDGDANGGDYCVECIDAEAEARKDPAHPNHDCRFVHGWDEAMETDSTPHCDGCGCLLNHSPTRYAVDEEIAYLAEVKEMDAANAAITHNWLSGMGDYDREEHWSLIKPHAERLMSGAGCVVVPDGFVTFRPRNIRDHTWYDFDTMRLAIYQYYAKKLVDHFGENIPHEFLNDTSSIRNSEFDGFSAEKQPRRHVTEFLDHVGHDTGRGRFLAAIGLKALADMETLITIPDERGARPCYDVRGRIIKGQPNSCHPNARVATHAELALSCDAKFWQYRIYYYFNHWDRSSWCISTTQKKNQRLSEFLDSLPDWTEKSLEPDVNEQWRSHNLRQWDKNRSAINHLFRPESYDDDDITFADLLQDRRITLSKRRLATIKRWIADDKKRYAEQQAKWEASRRR